MELEIRPAKPDEMDEFRKVAGSALMMKTPDYLGPELTLCAFADGKMATSYAAWNLTVGINRGFLPMAGITMVGTHPAFRRLGSLRKVTAKHFELLHEEGSKPISGLYASRAAIYRRYGYSPVVANCGYTVEPRYLQFAAGKESSGSFREATEQDIPVFSDLYNRFIENRTGYLKRSEENWKRRFAPAKQDRQTNFYMVYQENGVPQGYVIYTASLIPDGPHRWDQYFSISDLVWDTPGAYRAIWEYFSRMDVIYEINWGQAPEDDPLPYLLLEPRKLNKTSRDGLLARIIDVEKAMDKRGYDAEGTLTFAVRDDMCPWNEKTWKLEASPEGSTVQSTGESPQLVMPLSTLSLLYFGQLSATEAFRMGRLDAGNPDTLSTWDTVMRTGYRPACADNF